MLQHTVEHDCVSKFQNEVDRMVQTHWHAQGTLNAVQLHLFEQLIDLLTMLELGLHCCHINRLLACLIFLFQWIASEV